MKCTHENRTAGIAIANTWEHVPRGHCCGPHNSKAAIIEVVKCADCGKSWNPVYTR